jgi:hypothetical protein
MVGFFVQHYRVKNLVHDFTHGGNVASAASGLVRAHALQRKEIVAGVRLLGAVSDVSSDRILIQLPDQQSSRRVMKSMKAWPMARSAPRPTSDVCSIAVKCFAA